MSDLVRIGKIVVNLAYVQHIFEDPDAPGTWVIIMDSPMSSGRTIGTKAVRALQFSGEEAAALKWYVDNHLYDITQAHQFFLEGDTTRRKVTSEKELDRVLRKARFERQQATWDSGEATDE